MGSSDYRGLYNKQRKHIFETMPNLTLAKYSLMPYPVALVGKKMKQNGKGNQHINEIQPHTPIPKVSDQFQEATTFMLCLANAQNLQFTGNINESSDIVEIILHFLHPSAFYWLVKS